MQSPRRANLTHRPSIKVMLVLAIALTALLGAAAGWTMIRSIDASESARAEVELREERLQLTRIAEQSLLNQFLAMAGIAVLNDSSYIFSYIEARRNLTAAVDDLQELPAKNKAVAAAAVKIFAAEEALAAQSEEVFQLLQSGADLDPDAMIEKFDFEGGVTELLAMIGAAEELETRLLEEARERDGESQRTLTVVLVVTAIATFSLLVLFGLVSAFWVMRPIQQVSLATRRIARGELKHDVPTRGAAEISQLGRDVATMATALIERNDELAEYSTVPEERERRSRHIIEAAPDAIAMLRDHTIVLVNQAGLNLMDANSVEEVTGLDLTDRVPREDVEKVVRYLARPASNEYIQTSFGRDGARRDVELRAATFGVETQVIIRDVTARLEAEAKERDIERRLQQAQKMESLGILAGGAAHDFNNLLQVILGNAALARLSDGNAAVVESSLSEIERSAQRAAELTRQLVAYAGNAEFVEQQIDLGEIADEVVEMLLAVTSPHAEVVVDTPSSAPIGLGDPTQARQVVMNLITNATDAMGESFGRIRVETGIMAASADYLADAMAAPDVLPGNFAFVQVEDTGIGMDPETIDRMFDPFFSTKGMGRGLGLAAMLGIIRKHNGAVRVASAPGEGCTIRVLFPAV